VALARSSGLTHPFAPKTMAFYTFDQLQSALQDCTSYYLRQVKDEDGELAYALLDGCSDLVGSLFYDLEDLADYITNDAEIDEYLAELPTLH
jgi:hypothetical protein